MKTRSKSQSAGRTTHRGTDAQVVVQLFRMVTDKQYDFWIASINRAVMAKTGRAGPFTRDDQQKTISYWYLLMYLLEIFAADHNPFEVKKNDTWLSEGLVSMGQLSGDFPGRYKKETVRRYVFDLKKYGLVTLDGRGPDAKVQLTAAAIVALTDTVRQWVNAFRDVDSRIQKMRVM